MTDPRRHPDTVAITAGRGASGSSLAPVLFPSTAYETATLAEQAALVAKDADGFGHGMGRLDGMMQRLREERHIHGLVVDWKAFEVAPLPGDVPDSPARRERAGARQHLARSIHGDHAAGPLRGFE